MAKSKSGGTRSYLRGRIASDVYSIGRDSNGKKQQVVRSLAEQVKNPQTAAQMRGRMIMSTVMQAVSAMALLIDHSFDNVPNGQPSISEFIRRNYALIKADVAAHPSADNKFALSKYQEKGLKVGNYLLADGKALLPDSVSTDAIEVGGLIFNTGEAAKTAGAIRAALGFGGEDFITDCFITADGEFVFFRLNVSNALADDTAITQDNVAQLFTVDNPLGLALEWEFAGGMITINVTGKAGVRGNAIISRKTANGFEHNTCVLAGSGNANPAADVALPTYPEGTERFLNGGEL